MTEIIEEPRDTTEEDPAPAGKLVAHFKDGAVARGHSRDFRPDAEVFHLMSWDGGIASTRRIRLDDLKALFEVRSWGSATRHSERRKEFPPQPIPEVAAWETSARTIVEFYDGEEIWGYSRGYRSTAPGFFLVPADPHDNNRKIFVVSSSLVNVQFLDH